METIETKGWDMKRNWTWLPIVGCCLTLASCDAIAAQPGACDQTARDAQLSCEREASGEYWLGVAVCDNLPAADQRECGRQAQTIRLEVLGECDAHFESRQEICAELGRGAYNPVIAPENFLTVVDNPLFPLVPGTTFVYEGPTEGGTEHIEFVVTRETKEIMGVTCVQVRDTVTVDGELVEDTLDWFAQDVDGNVWYFGENSKDYEDGLIVSLDGSWTAGIDGAKPGIIMKAAPRVGELYRQEFAIGEAEDVARVLSLSQSVTVPYGAYSNCLQTQDFAPLDPDAIEHKFYAPGVGQVLTVHVDTGTRVELVNIFREGDGQAIPLKEAKLNIEHNATALDTGFQGAIDSEGWSRLDITGPSGTVMTIEGKGELGSLGLTELFFETVEPENAEVPIADMLALLPEGNYTIQGPTVDGVPTYGTAWLTHDIPAGPVLLAPAEGATVPTGNLVMRWSPVTQTITGGSINIISYQLIIEKDEPPHPHAIGKRGLSMYLPASTTSLTVPNEFLEPSTHYLWEVLAIEVSGNQTLSSGEFTTE